MSVSNLQDLIRGYIEDDLSPDQLAELMEELKKGKHFPVFESQLEQALASGAFAGRADAEQRGIIFDRVLQAIRSQGRRRRLPFFRPAAAAALIMLLAGGGYWLSRYTSRRETAITSPQVRHDIAPGHNGAILTLSGGTRIVLDSAANGQVASEGAVAIVKKDGQLFYKRAGSESEVLYNSLTTPRGRQYQLVLPDGSTVWLNAASSIRFPSAFPAGAREVEMTGEAYFEIAGDKSRPFIVHTSGTAVSVLGTAFNINAYSDEGAVKTTLAEGAVKVEHERKDLVLQAGHQTVWDRTSGAFFEQKADVEQATAWKDGRFEFDHTDLGTILRQLARWYDVDIRYAAKAGEGEYGGNISRQLNLDETLKLLESNDTSLRFRVEAKTVVVERKEVERK